MKFKKTSAVLLVLAILCCTFTACGNSPATTDTGADYAIILKTLSNDFWAKMKTGIEEEAKALGVRYKVGNLLSSDVFYHANPKFLRLFLGCLRFLILSI